MSKANFKVARNIFNDLRNVQPIKVSRKKGEAAIRDLLAKIASAQNQEGYIEELQMSPSDVQLLAKHTRMKIPMEYHSKITGTFSYIAGAYI